MNTNILTFPEGSEKEAAKTDPDSTKTGFCSRAYVMCFCLYLLQGGVVSLAITMPYLYPTLPTYRVLALFTSTHIPFSCKFLLCNCPLTQLPSSRSTQV